MPNSIQNYYFFGQLFLTQVQQLNVVVCISSNTIQYTMMWNIISSHTDYFYFWILQKCFSYTYVTLIFVAELLLILLDYFPSLVLLLLLDILTMKGRIVLLKTSIQFKYILSMVLTTDVFSIQFLKTFILEVKSPYFRSIRLSRTLRTSDAVGRPDCRRGGKSHFCDWRMQERPFCHDLPWSTFFFYFSVCRFHVFTVNERNWLWTPFSLYTWWGK